MNGKLSRDKFDWILSNIHLGRPEDEEQLIDEDVSPVQDGEFKLEEKEKEEECEVEIVPNNDDDWGWVGINGDDDSDGDNNLECSIDIDTGVEDDNEEDIVVWCAKAKLFLDCVNDFNRVVSEYRGLNLSLDEMIKLFKGCSSMTVQMKKKPIKEEYKFIKFLTM